MPTAINKYGHKINTDGFTFDSQKEYDFYSRFIKGSSFEFTIHPPYRLEDLSVLDGGVKVRAIRYTPDVVVFNHDGSMVSQLRL